MNVPQLNVINAAKALFRAKTPTSRKLARKRLREATETLLRLESRK